MMISDTIPADSYPYGEKLFDDSPVKRVMKQGFPGSSWQLSAHPQKFSYLSNSSYDQVRLFEYNEATAQFSSSGNYDVNTLFVGVIYDENGNQFKTFKDKSGKVVLKETSLSGTRLRTYYIYDLYDNLVLVIQPEGSIQVSGSFSSTPQFINRWCFTYHYDSRNRLIEKHIPGMNKPVYMVYDSLDRLILTQDGNLKTSDLYDLHWYFTKYDALGRPVLEGLYQNRADTAREDMQLAADAYIAQHSYFESRSGTQYSTRKGYTDNAFPPLDSCEILKVFYYDDYDFDKDSQEDYSYHELNGFVDLDYLDFPYGMLTATRFKILLEPLLQDPFLFTVNFYDKKSRVIQEQSRNHSGHFDTLTTRYNFVGDPVLSHYSFSGTQECHVVYDSMEYDHARRLKRGYKKIDAQDWFQMTELNYNELGQLVEKNLHRTGITTFLQSLDYSYNIRGWLNGINIRSNGNDTRDLYYQQLLYDSTISTLQSSPQYNGNIAAEIWWHYENTSRKGYGLDRADDFSSPRR